MQEFLGRLPFRGQHAGINFRDADNAASKPIAGLIVLPEKFAASVPESQAINDNGRVEKDSHFRFLAPVRFRKACSVS